MARIIFARRCLLSARLALWEEQVRISHHPINSRRNRSLCRRHRLLSRVMHNRNIHRHHNPDTSSRVTSSHTSGRHHNPGTTHNRVTPTPVTHSPTTTRHHNLDTMPSQVPNRAPHNPVTHNPVTHSPVTHNPVTTPRRLALRLTRQQKFSSQCSRMCSVFSSAGSVRWLCFSRTASAGRSFGNTRGTTSIFN